MPETLRYGNETVPLPVPFRSWERLRPAPFEGPSPGNDEQEILRQALAAPYGAGVLRDQLQPTDTVCVVTCDVTRLWTRPFVYLPAILREIQAAGIAPEQITFLVGTGDHRQQSAAELQLLLGDAMVAGCRVVQHDARNSAVLDYRGETSRGTPVWIHHEVQKADRVILTGGIVHHFLAGFSGGLKALVPGVAGRETIMANHALALHPEPGRGPNLRVRAGFTDGNPCFEDLVEAARLVQADFLLNVIVDGSGKIVDAVAGQPETAHHAGQDRVQRRFTCPIAAPRAAVLASSGGFPGDINLYQTYKTLYHARMAVQAGGSVLLLAECREGFGSEEFEHMLLRVDPNRREEHLRQQFTIGGYMAYHFAILAQEVDVYLVSHLDPAALESTGIRTFSTLDEATEALQQKHPGGVEGYILPSSHFVPIRMEEDFNVG